MKFLILFVCVVSVLAVPGKKETKQSEKENSDQKEASNEADENPICDKNLQVNSTICCPNIPNLNQFFDTCKTSCNITDDIFKKNGPSPDKKDGPKGDKKGFQFNPQMTCLFKCVRDSAGISDSTGNVSTDLLSKKLLENADPAWASIVPDAVTGCFNNITAMFANKTCNKSDGKGRKGRDGKKSGPDNAPAGGPPNFADMLTGILLKCVDKNLYLSCPSLVNSTDCNELTTKLTVCKCKHGHGPEKEHDENNESGKGKPQKYQKAGRKGDNKSAKNSQKEQQQQKGKTDGNGKNQQQKSKSAQTGEQNQQNRG